MASTWTGRNCYRLPLEADGARGRVAALDKGIRAATEALTRVAVGRQVDRCA